MVMHSVLKSLQIFELVAENQPARLAEIAPLIDLPRSTVQRNLETLAHAGWIRVAGGDVTRWEVTPRTRALILRSSADVTLVGAAQQTMAELRDATGETVQLKALSGTDDFIVLEHADTRFSVRPVMALGTILPILASSSGFGVLEKYTEAARSAVIERTRAKEPFDPAFSVDTDEEIERQIEFVRAHGYAVRMGWLGDVMGMGSVIVDRFGAPIAGLSLTVPLDRYDASRQDEFGTAVAEAAARISLELASA